MEHPPPDRSRLDESRVLEVRQIAGRLRVSEEFIRRMIRAGKLKAFRLNGLRGPWRVTEQDLTHYLSMQRGATASNKSEPPPVATV